MTSYSLAESVDSSVGVPGNASTELFSAFLQRHSFHFGSQLSQIGSTRYHLPCFGVHTYAVLETHERNGCCPYHNSWTSPSWNIPISQRFYFWLVSTHSQHTSQLTGIQSSKDCIKQSMFFFTRCCLPSSSEPPRRLTDNR